MYGDGDDHGDVSKMREGLLVGVELGKEGKGN
jgi:hypothetical protein